MAEERITTVEPAGDTPGSTAHTTIIREETPRGGGGSGWLIAIVLIVALIAGLYIFTQTSASEAVKNDAIANAANEVGDAAGAVGEAAGQVGNAVENAADNLQQ